MNDNIVKEMIQKISRRAKSWEKRNKNTSKGMSNPYTEFGFLDNKMNPIKIDELKQTYGKNYNYKIGILKNISQSDYIKVRDKRFIDNLKYMAEQNNDTELLKQLNENSQSKIMIDYYEGKFDEILHNFDSNQIVNSKTLETATEKLKLFNNRP